MKNNDNLVWKKSIHVGRFDIVLEKRRVNNTEHQISYVSMPECVCILPVVGDRILMLKQYRISIGSWEYEIPGGAIVEGEGVEEAAKRELSEETGYTVSKLKSLGSFYPSPGSTNEKAWLFMGECVKTSAPQLDPLEDIRCELITIEHMKNLINSGEIRHSMTLIAWMRYMNLNNK